ncbi:MAG TPA: hypothetical protein VH302_10235 [Bryobacteraceae bacterium]|nr:hypothetical protein [Bryobacteraceae bacterium]
MAAIARDRMLGRGIAMPAAAVMATLTLWAQPAANPSSSARQQVAAVAEALSAGDATEAMTHFAKTLPDYEKVSKYFDGLAAFQVENQIDFTDEDDSDTAVIFAITWDITLTDLGTDRTRNRSGQIHVKVASVESKWRIVEFSPLDIFNPQLH